MSDFVSFKVKVIEVGHLLCSHHIASSHKFVIRNKNRSSIDCNISCTTINILLLNFNHKINNNNNNI